MSFRFSRLASIRSFLYLTCPTQPNPTQPNPKPDVKFLDKARIKAILINEGITMHRVVFYLAFVVAGRDKMVVAFENLKPRLHVLVKIYRCIMRHKYILGVVDVAHPFPASATRMKLERTEYLKSTFCKSQLLKGCGRGRTRDWALRRRYTRMQKVLPECARGVLCRRGCAFACFLPVSLIRSTSSRQ